MPNTDNIPSTSEITPESLYLRRREFLRDALLFTATTASVGTGLLWLMQGNRASKPKSSAAWVKRLGYTRWKQLHRLAYIAPLLGVLHFTWRVKKDVSEPLTYAFIVGILLLVRVAAAMYARRTTSVPG